MLPPDDFQDIPQRTSCHVVAGLATRLSYAKNISIWETTLDIESPIFSWFFHGICVPESFPFHIQLGYWVSPPLTP